MANKFIERIEEINPLALVADGYNGAIIGIATDISGRLGNGVLIYSKKKMVRLAMKNNKWDHEEAVEYLEFNTWGAHVGEGTPIYVDDLY